MNVGVEKKVAARRNVQMQLRVNGEPIYKSDYEIALESLPAQAKAIAAKPAGRRLILDEIVKLKILKQQAEKMGVDKDPAIIVQKWNWQVGLFTNTLVLLAMAERLRLLEGLFPTQTMVYICTYPPQYKQEKGLQQTVSRGTEITIAPASNFGLINFGCCHVPKNVVRNARSSINSDGSAI